MATPQFIGVYATSYPAYGSGPAPAQYDTTLLIPSNGASQTAHGMRLSAPPGDKIEFNRLTGSAVTEILPGTMYPKEVSGSADKTLDFILSYVGQPFRYTPAGGTAYSNNTFQNADAGITLS